MAGDRGDDSSEDDKNMELNKIEKDFARRFEEQVEDAKDIITVWQEKSKHYETYTRDALFGHYKLMEDHIIKMLNTNKEESKQHSDLFRKLMSTRRRAIRGLWHKEQDMCVRLDVEIQMRLYRAEKIVSDTGLLEMTVHGGLEDEKEEDGDGGNGQSKQSPNEDNPLGVRSCIVKAEERTESWKSKGDAMHSSNPDGNVETNQRVAQDDSVKTATDAGEQVRGPTPIALDETSSLNGGRRMFLSKGLRPVQSRPPEDTKTLGTVLILDGKVVNSKQMDLLQNMVSASDGVSEDIRNEIIREMSREIADKEVNIKLVLDYVGKRWTKQIFDELLPKSANKKVESTTLLVNAGMDRSLILGGEEDWQDLVHHSADDSYYQAGQLALIKGLRPVQSSPPDDDLTQSLTVRTMVRDSMSIKDLGNVAVKSGDCFIESQMMRDSMSMEDLDKVAFNSGDCFNEIQMIHKITMIGGWNNAGENYTDANAGEYITDGNGRQNEPLNGLRPVPSRPPEDKKILDSVLIFDGKVVDSKPPHQNSKKTSYKKK
jgi:hypothetical protein